VSTDLAPLFQHIISGNNSDELEAQFPFYPLDAPGMGIPGPNFETAALALESQGGVPKAPYLIAGKGSNRYIESYGPYIHYLYRRALYDNMFQLPVNVKGNMVNATIVPGHLMGDETHNFNGGPRAAKVMVIGKQPGPEDVMYKRNCTGPKMADFFEALDSVGVDEVTRADWYVTNLVKWPQLDRQSDALAQAWVRDCAILLQQELRLVSPDYILCLGSHASKALLGTWAGVNNMTGRVETLRIPTFDRGQQPMYKEAKVMAATHPSAVYSRPEMFSAFKDQLELFANLTKGAQIGSEEQDIDHRVIYKARELDKLVHEIRADPSRWFIAVDGEWHGEYPTDKGAYLRTVQFSSQHGEGITVALRHQGGSPAFKPSIQHGVDLLNKLLLPEGDYRPRVGGHFFRADAPWLIHEGIDIRPSYAMPAELSKANTGGWDTSVMYHATNESTSYKLEDVATRLTTAPRYDKKLQKWREAYCNVNGMSSKDMEGYGMCPEWVLHPYGCYDADVTRRIAVRCEQDLLNKDWFENNSWKPYWVAHRASPAFLEMEMNGIELDRERLDELSRLYVHVRDALLHNLRQRINWPKFNPESNIQSVALLFGDQYAYRTDKHTGEKIPIRPSDAMTLNLTPIKSTGKRSKLWDQVVAKNEQHLYVPSTDKEVLGILGHEHEVAMQLRDLKFVSQALKSVLRPPEIDPETMTGLRDDDGNYVYSKGLASMVSSDGAVRTHISQLKETGRASSYRPPLQNLSKRREDDYARILGIWSRNAETGEEVGVGDYLDVFGQPLYTHPIRSILRAREGHVLVECDYTGAELAVIAWLANDPVMIDHVRRNTLPEDHPDHFDIHSQTAVRVFGLDCAPTKRGLKEAGMKGMRVAAKNVNFGIPYGRAAPAIARQCREEGVEISVEDTERIVDYYFQTYQGTVDFLKECGNRVKNPGWLCTAFGRYRRFVSSDDRAVLGEQKRQAQNFPIQGTVADAVSRALDNLYYNREASGVEYKLILQIHDAVLFEVPYAHLRRFKEEVLPREMVTNVPIWPTYLDGTYRPGVTEPYHFGIDTDVQINWGEDITEAQAIERNIDLDLI
jgi:uracil-DNA glycosylase family 4